MSGSRNGGLFFCSLADLLAASAPNLVPQPSQFTLSIALWSGSSFCHEAAICVITKRIGALPRPQRPGLFYDLTKRYGGVAIASPNRVFRPPRRTPRIGGRFWLRSARQPSSQCAPALHNTICDHVRSMACSRRAGTGQYHLSIWLLLMKDEAFYKERAQEARMLADQVRDDDELREGWLRIAQPPTVSRVTWRKLQVLLARRGFAGNSAPPKIAITELDGK